MAKAKNEEVKKFHKHGKGAKKGIFKAGKKQKFKKIKNGKLIEPKQKKIKKNVAKKEGEKSDKKTMKKKTFKKKEGEKSDKTTMKKKTFKGKGEGENSDKVKGENWFIKKPFKKREGKDGKTWKQPFKKREGKDGKTWKHKQGTKRKFEKPLEKPDWKEIKQANKKKKLEKKEAKPNAELSKCVMEAYTKNFLAAKKKDPKAKLVQEVLDNMGEKIKDLKTIIPQKGVGRAVILLIKNGNMQQRLHIASSLKGGYVTLGTHASSCHVILALLRYGNKESRKLVCEEVLKGTIKLMNNRYGGMILDRILVDTELKHWRLLMLQHLYSKLYVQLPEFDDKGTPLSLAQLIEKFPDQKNFMIENMQKFLENALSKYPSLVVVQIIVYQFLLYCNADEYQVMVNLIQPLVENLLTSEEGCLSIVRAFDFTNAKQRKKMLQQCKDKIVKMCMDKNEVLILIRALMVTDDTVLLKKIILNSLIASVDDVFTSVNGRLIFVQILSPRNERYFKKRLQHLPEPIVASKEVKRFNCKKANEVRQKELLKHVLPTLVEFCEKNIKLLLSQSEPLLYLVLKQCFGTLVPLPEKGEELLQKICAYSQENLETIFNDKTSHRRLRGLAELVPEFCDVMMKNLSDEEIVQIAFTKGVLALVRCGQKSEDYKTKLQNVLRPSLKKLQGAGDECKGVKILIEELSL